jgi:hypothetical protein
MAQYPMRPGTYLLFIAPHCTRAAAKALTVKTRNKNDSKYFDMNSKNTSQQSAVSTQPKTQKQFSPQRSQRTLRKN